jgi:hypothetical protein
LGGRKEWTREETRYLSEPGRKTLEGSSRDCVGIVDGVGTVFLRTLNSVVDHLYDDSIWEMRELRD